MLFKASAGLQELDSFSSSRYLWSAQSTRGLQRAAGVRIKWNVAPVSCASIWSCSTILQCHLADAFLQGDLHLRYIALQIEWVHYHLSPSSNLAAVSKGVAHHSCQMEKGLLGNSSLIIGTILPSSQDNIVTWNKTDKRHDYFSGEKHSSLLTVLSGKDIQQRCEVHASDTSYKTLPSWSPCLSL